MGRMTIEANQGSNRLYMKLSGFFTDDEMQQVYDRFTSEAKKLKEGFDVMTDTSEFKPTTPKSASIVNQTQKLAKEMGLHRVIRIVGTGAGQMHVAHELRELVIRSNQDTALVESEVQLVATTK